MQRFIGIACLTALAAATPVFAQENANEADESISDPAVCLIGDHADFPEADARTAAFLVCRHLRNQGVQVGEPVYDAPDSAAVYRVSLRILGQYVLVYLAQEEPVGTVVEERELLLAGIEEMVSAAPRLVDALVNRTSLAATIDETLQTDSLTTEVLQNRKGLRLGISADVVIILPFFGIDIGYAGVRGRISASTVGDETVVHANIAFSPTSGKNWSPYFGVGVASIAAGDEGYFTLLAGLERRISKSMQLNIGVVALLVQDADFLPAAPVIGFRIGL